MTGSTESHASAPLNALQIRVPTLHEQKRRSDRVWFKKEPQKYRLLTATYHDSIDSIGFDGLVFMCCESVNIWWLV